MKIGLVCPYNMAKGGGVQEVVRALKIGLIARGHDVRIITPRPLGEFEPEPDVIYLGQGADFKTPLGTVAQLSISIDTVAAKQMLEAEAFDVLHFHEPWVPIMSRQLIGLCDAPRVATFHAKLPDNVMAKSLSHAITPYTKSILKHFQVLSAVSTAALEYVDTLTDREIHIVPNGVDLQSYTGKSPRGKAANIVYIGRLEKRKGVAHLLRAFARISAEVPTAKLTIAGDGVLRTQLETLAFDELRLGGRVTFLGYITEQKKHELLQQATVFSSPALYGESFGIVLLEAMASGAVVVAGDNPGYRSVLTGLGSLSLVNPQDEMLFAQKLRLFSENQPLRALHQAWAKESIGQYDYDVVTARYEALYVTAQKSGSAQ